MAHWLGFDIDSETAGFDWYDCNGPAPNFVIQNPANGHAHYLFGLLTPVCTSPQARMAPMRYLAGLESGLSARLGADQGYSGLIVKNPLQSAFWRVWQPRQELYSLDELADYTDPSRTRTHTRTREVRSFGRNVSLFDQLRFWAYDRVESARAGNYGAWVSDVTAQAMTINAEFPDPLRFAEMASTARSVAKWSWKHYDSRHDGKIRGRLGYGTTRHEDPEAMRLTPEQKRQRQQAGQRYMTASRQADTEAKIKQAVAKLRLAGKRLTTASVSRESGLHRNTVASYKHLIS